MIRPPPPRKDSLHIAGLAKVRENCEPARIALRVFDALRELAGEGDVVSVNQNDLAQKTGLPRRAVVGGLQHLGRVGLKVEGLDA